MGTAGAMKAGKLTLVGTALCAMIAGLLTAPPASAASFEQAGTFAGSAAPVAEEKFTEEVQLGGVGGMAVNIDGTGGVPAGTVYAASYIGGLRIAMFTPKADGGLEFREAWTVTVDEGAYERCGPEGELPDGELVHPVCVPRVKAGPGVVDVEVDQGTGNVYVFNGPIISAGFSLITIYKADGSAVISRFGKRAAEGKTVAETPGEIHSSPYPGGITVKGAGEVYVYDETQIPSFYHRLMVFKPKTPGNYAEYEYAGEVAAGSGAGNFPTAPVSDAAGNIYAGGGAEGEHIEMYAPQAPAPYPAAPATPACSFTFPKSGITAVTVNPKSGEVFFFTYKKEGGKKFVHQLGPCNEATGKFEGPKGEEETGKFEVKPERDDLWGLAFDPKRQPEGRPAGVLYAGAPGPVPSSGVGPGEPGQSSLGYVFAGHEDKESPPLVLSESVSRVTATGAGLHAQIDPKGIKTSYAFQYITEAEYEANPPGERFAGATEAPLGGAPLAGTLGSQSAVVAVAGLVPDTAYRYRALAASKCSSSEPGKACVSPGAAQGFRTFPPQAPGLPDHRAWEMVSPAQKHSGQVLPADPTIDSCSEIECKPGGTYEHFPMQSAPGGGAIVYEGTPFGEEGALIENEYVARRDAKAGWQTTNLTPRLLLSNKRGAGYMAFDETLTEGVLEQLRPPLSPAVPGEYADLYSQPASDPLTLAPFITEEPSNRPETGTSAFKLIYAGASADLSRVFFAANDALTEATPFAPEALDGGAAKYNLYEWERSTGQLALVNVSPGNATTEAGASFGPGSANTISEDGSRAFWSTATGQLYVREDTEATLPILGSGPGAKFLAAATDGSRVLLTDGHLYDLGEEETTDLTEGKGGFQGLLGQSEDLTHAYFVDTAVLDEAPNQEGEGAEAGKDNLYAWSGGQARFVARLIAQDNSGVGSSPASDWNSIPAFRTAQASPAGRYLAFLSQARLTGYDNVGPCEADHAGGFVAAPCPQAFLYDSAAEELTCPSCNPSGTKPLGWAVLRLIKGGPGPQPRYLTDEGRLYFDSQDSLSLADTNEGIEDVYEYEPGGAGDCTREAGCVALVSAGTGSVDSNLLAVDESGANVFFTSRDPLALRDKDDLIDLYDAREGGGIPSETEAADPECQGEACQPPPVVPGDPTPGSSSFEGPGNAAEEPQKKAPCAKGKVRRKGRCVTKKHAKKAHHRRGRANHNRGGMK